MSGNKGRRPSITRNYSQPDSGIEFGSPEWTSSIDSSRLWLYGKTKVISYNLTYNRTSFLFFLSKSDQRQKFCFLFFLQSELNMWNYSFKLQGQRYKKVVADILPRYDVVWKNWSYLYFWNICLSFKRQTSLILTAYSFISKLDWELLL